MAQPYIDASAMAPDLFYADEAREYMWLVKRYIGDATETEEQLLIVSDEKGVVRSFLPDPEKGALGGINLYNVSTEPMLSIMYFDENYMHSCDFYSLPFATQGIEDVVSAGAETLVTVDAAGIHAADCRLAVYNAAGIRVAAGRDFISTDNFVNGIYVVTATDANGDVQTVKFEMR